MSNATKQLKEVCTHAETIKNDGPHDMATMEVGDEWRQGDVRMIRLPDDALDRFSDDLELDMDFDGQVAPGSTMGSRHTIDDPSGCAAYRLKRGNALDGPIVATKKPTTLRHPEHGDCCNMPAGVYAFPGQRSFAEELRRTRD